MPERPKRRKNNKNKRKNKNNRPDVNKSSNDSQTLDNSELSNNQTGNESISVDSAVSETIGKDTSLMKDKQLQENEIVSSSSSNKLENVNEDLNNNSSNPIGNDSNLDATCSNIEDNFLTDTPAYVVESPEQSLKSKTKLKHNNKSKSLDNDEDTKIIEITEENCLSSEENSLTLIDCQNVLVTHVDSDVEWEKTDELNDFSDSQKQEIATGTLSVTTIPLSIAQCEETKSLTPDEEKSLRNYLKTLNLVTQPENVNSIEIKTEIEQIINHEIKQRLRKKGLAEDFFVQRIGPPRILDVIDEEGSSESSMTSRRQSYLSDKKSDIEDLEDDVFEDKSKPPRSKQLAASSSFFKKSFGQLIPQQCVLVDTKIKEPDVTEARGDWTVKTIEKMTGAEVVYLTDTSSSTSSIHEVGDDDESMDNDVSVRIITPTIEVTDTENFLKKSFISKEDNSVAENKNSFSNKRTEDTLQEKKELSGDKEHFTKIEYETNQEDDKQTTANKVIDRQKTDNNVNIDLDNTKNKEHIISVEVKDILKDVSENTKFINKNENEGNHKAHQNKVLDQNEDYKNAVKLTDLKPTEHIIKVKYENNYKNEAINTHEIVVLSIDDIKTNLIVKDLDDSLNTLSDSHKQIDEPKPSELDLKTKLIKCEFNDAINNLIKEVSSDSEEANENMKDLLTRQDSSSSIGSSQCTAKYNPTYSSLNDISNIVHDDTGMNSKSNIEKISSTASHVKHVFECVTGASTQNKSKVAHSSRQPLKLKDLCVKNIAKLPYGDKILEELASVSQRLQNIANLKSDSQIITSENTTGKNDTMPHYELPDISPIETILIPSKPKEPIPPPVQPRHSSLKKTQDDDHWTGIPTKSEPLYVCLSPSQKMLMEKTNTIITREDASHLVDMHRKYVDRRGYNEQFKNDKQKLENEFDDTPIVPFKSQTGSRLLALIRDPTLTKNINSLHKRLNNSYDDIQRKVTTTNMAKTNFEQYHTSRDFSFKPIPPPRPKKYSAYESDESSDFTDSSLRSMRSEKKYFHYSTGNLNKEIESDISTIQNMHRYFNNTRDEFNYNKCPRRPSLPKDLCEQQMEYIRQKEKEVEAEIQRLENLKLSSQNKKKGPKAPLVSEKEVIDERIKDSDNYYISKKKDIFMSSNNISSLNDSDSKKGKLSSLFSSSQEELLREKMYSEYVDQMAQREERKQNKVIKITNTSTTSNPKTVSKSMSALDILESKVNNKIEKEFISKARERWDKLGIKDPETEDEQSANVYKEPKVIEHKIKVIESGELKDVKKLPSHLQEFVRFTAKDTDPNTSSSGESSSGASPHLVIMCAVIIIVIAVGKYFLRLLRYN